MKVYLKVNGETYLLKNTASRTCTLEQAADEMRGVLATDFKSVQFEIENGFVVLGPLALKNATILIQD